MMGCKLSFPTLLHWNRDRKQIIEKISGEYRPLKILLKTKDDPELLVDWIEHHRQIAGSGGIIIFDNMSSDPEVEKIYNRYQADISVFRYEGFHNVIHHAEYFADLYRSLRDSCGYFTFLDTDERLGFIDDNLHFHANSTLENHLARSSANVIPGTWLQNITSYSDRFALDLRLDLLRSGLKWGKPLIRATSGFAGMINHNVQIERCLYPERIETNFFVLHLSKLSNTLRIKANVRKLRAYGTLAEDEGIDQVLRLNVASLPDQTRMYASEVLHLINLGNEPVNSTGSIRIVAGYALECSFEWQREALQSFLTEPMNFTTDLFSASDR